MGKNPKHIVSVSAFVTNKAGEVLLVKTHWRSDTWEMPGGQVEEGEPLDQAVIREVYEETRVVIEPIGITGVYYNSTKRILNVVFKSKVIEGELQIQPEEIKEARFVPLNESTISTYFTRPHFESRIRDAISSQISIPYETWVINPSRLVSRVRRACW